MKLLDPTRAHRADDVQLGVGDVGFGVELAFAVDPGLDRPACGWPRRWPARREEIVPCFAASMLSSRRPESSASPAQRPSGCAWRPRRPSGCESGPASAIAHPGRAGSRSRSTRWRCRRRGRSRTTRAGSGRPSICIVVVHDEEVAAGLLFGVWHRYLNPASGKRPDCSVLKLPAAQTHERRIGHWTDYAGRGRPSKSGKDNPRPCAVAHQVNLASASVTPGLRSHERQA